MSSKITPEVADYIERLEQENKIYKKAIESMTERLYDCSGISKNKSLSSKITVDDLLESYLDEARMKNKICSWCKQQILPGQATVFDSDGDELHLGCDIEISDGQIIDNECGDR